MPRERARALKDTIDRLFLAHQVTFGPMEWLPGTVRNQSLVDFSYPFSEITNVFETNSDLLEKYFDDKLNPIISGYRRGMTEDAFYDEVITKQIWAHQVTGGAAGGRPSDEHAVSDGRGRIYNVQGLRVADASFIPTPPHGNPWVAVAQVGAIISRFVLDDWNNSYRFVNIAPLEPDHPLYVHKTPLNRHTLPPSEVFGGGRFDSYKFDAVCFGKVPEPYPGDCDEYGIRDCKHLDSGACSKNKCCTQRISLVPGLDGRSYFAVQDVVLIVAIGAAASGFIASFSIFYISVLKPKDTVKV